MRFQEVFTLFSLEHLDGALCNMLREIRRTPSRRTSQNTPSETVWKVHMGFALGSRKPEKRVEKRPYRHVALLKTRDLDPSSYVPNSFSAHVGE